MDLSAAPKDENSADADLNCRDTKQIMSKLLGDKEEEWAAVTRNGVLNLLDLPVDILKEIIKEASAPSHTCPTLLTSWYRSLIRMT